MAKTPLEIKTLARSHTEAALRVLAGIMRQKDAPPAARVAAAQALLDRGWGKAVQALEVEVTKIYVARMPARQTTDIDQWQKTYQAPSTQTSQ